MQSKYAMRRLMLVLILLLSACGLEPSGKKKPAPKADTKHNNGENTVEPIYTNKDAARFKGYHAINQIISTRLIDQPDLFRLSQYLDTSFDDGPNLAALLGVYKGTGRQNGFINGTPNATNMLLWSLVMRGLAKDAVDTVCNNNGYTTFRQEFIDALEKFCGGLPKTTTKQKQTLWNQMIRYDAPQEEMTAWIEFTEAGQSDSLEAVEEAIVAAMLNPYFLLKQ